MNRTNIGLSGRIAWEIIEDGESVQAGEQSNLITDYGLDQLATHGIQTVAQNYRFASAWKEFLSVGDGNTPPDVSQSSLVHVLASSSNPGGIDERFTKISDSVYEWETTREIGLNDGNGNLTEFAFGPNSGGVACVRELFRDLQGNPVVLTKTATQKLRVKHTLRVEIGPVVPVVQSTLMSGDASGDLGGQFVLTDISSNGRSQFAAYVLVHYWLALPQAVLTAADDFGGALSFEESTRQSNIVGQNAIVDMPPYVAGSFRRTFTTTFDTGNAVGTFHGVRLSVNRDGYPVVGARWQFANPFTKDNTHRLIFRDWTLTWGRTPPAQIN